MNADGLGIGAMLNMLSGNEETVRIFKASLGKKITALELDPSEDGALRFTFEDGLKIRFCDDARSCCEKRYMNTDDDLKDFVGGTLDWAEVRDAPNVENEYGETHEVQFLVVKTSKGQFTISTHNEHNGYYGGICIVVRSE